MLYKPAVLRTNAQQKRKEILQSNRCRFVTIHFGLGKNCLVDKYRQSLIGGKD